MLDDDGKWFRVSLRLAGDSLDPLAVESVLGLKPIVTGLKGEPRQGNSGRSYAPYQTNLWIYEHDSPQERPFEDQLTDLFLILGPRALELKKLCSTEGVEGDIFLGFSSGNGQGGSTLSSELLFQIADAGLSLTLDLYPPG